MFLSDVPGLLLVQLRRRIKSLSVFKTKYTEAFAPAQESRRHGFSIARFVASIVKQIPESTTCSARTNSPSL